MSVNALVRMANEIAANFGALGEADAIAETARHISRFWEPRMRAQLKQLVADGEADGLSAIAARAVKQI